MYAPAGGMSLQSQTSGFPYLHSIVQDTPRGLGAVGEGSQSELRSSRRKIPQIYHGHRGLDRTDNLQSRWEHQHSEVLH